MDLLLMKVKKKGPMNIGHRKFYLSILYSAYKKG